VRFVFLFSLKVNDVHVTGPEPQIQLRPEPKSQLRPEPRSQSRALNLVDLMVPIYSLHLKPGSTLSTNGEIVILQDGSTNIQAFHPPNFRRKNVPWLYGHIRDMIWSFEMKVFLLLTKNSVIGLNYQELIPRHPPALNPRPEFTLHTFMKVKPYDNLDSFWRCTCAQMSLFIAHAGN
jgi:hypothetical protein